MNRVEKERVDVLAGRFADRYGRPPAVVVRAPGRVNLIGEHTDYNGLAVLPMAIDRSVLVAAAPREDRCVELANVEKRFSQRCYVLQDRIAPFAAGDWGNYNKAASQGLTRVLGGAGLRGGEFLVDSDIPAGAGLSSSSALVVGSALAFLALAGCEVEPTVLAEQMASAERYVGTLSGGMDQAACLLAREGEALRIDFDPVRVRHVPLDPSFAFVVCDSLVPAQKSGAARAAYNRRVVECRLACRVIETLLAPELREPLPHLGALRERFPRRQLTDFVDLLENAVPDKPLSVDELAAIAGTDAAELTAAVGGGGDRQARYAVCRRARHVLCEARRVDRAEEALRAGDWREFGRLMDASHASCRDDYEISRPEIERLVEAAKEAGALGARLTGAGFGGCTVSLVPREGVPALLVALDRVRDMAGATHEQSRFVSAARRGAEIFARRPLPNGCTLTGGWRRIYSPQRKAP